MPLVATAANQRFRTHRCNAAPPTSRLPREDLPTDDLCYLHRHFDSAATPLACLLSLTATPDGPSWWTPGPRSLLCPSPVETALPPRQQIAHPSSVLPTGPLSRYTAPHSPHCTLQARNTLHVSCTPKWTSPCLEWICYTISTFRSTYPTRGWWMLTPGPGSPAHPPVVLDLLACT